MPSLPPLGLFDDDDTLEPTQAEVTAAYAQLLILNPPVRSVDVNQVGQEKARRNAVEFARKDVSRYESAVTLAKQLRKERMRSSRI